MSTIVEYIINLRGNLVPQINAANTSAQQLGGTIDSVRNSAMSLGNALGIAFGVAGVAMFVKNVVNAGTTVENAQTGLTTLLKSSDEAAGVIKNTMEDATKTPFAFEGLLQANKALIGAGVESTRAREDVLNLANAIAATGGGDVELQRMVVNLQQISNTGKATAMDIRQFAYAGINIYKVLAEATGQPIEKVKDMEVSYDMLTKALKKAHAEGGIYYNGLENMASNTSVKISNVGDSLFQFMNSVFTESKPLIDDVLASTLVGVSKLTPAFKSLVEFIKEYKTEITFLVGAYAAYKAIVITSMALEAAKTAIMTVSAAWTIAMTTYEYTRALGIGVLTSAQWALNAAMSANPIALFVIGIASVVAVVYELYTHFDSVKIVIDSVWGALKGFGSNAMELLKGLGNIVLGVFDPTKMALGLSQVAKVVEGIKDGFNQGGANAKIELTYGKDAYKTNEDGGVDSLTGKGAGVLDGTKGAAKKPTNEAVATPKTKAEGQKTINIHVAYNAPLIQGFTISTTNVKEGFDELKTKVTAILTGATHDSLMVADN